MITARMKGKTKEKKTALVHYLKNEIIVRIYKADETLMRGVERKR